MAPSRRKGRAAATAAAAAAARQQWKVGDLVLAKMKGFPAWPATISEPQKWGYSSDRKKLLVYFFGTKQIAFCNHADLEAFTEEKKKTLLIKRQGKGGDFVRAVDEIIESFESLKKQKHNVELNFGVEGVESNVGKLEGSSIKSLIESPNNGPNLTPNDQSETCYASIQSNGPCSLEEVPVSSTEDNALQNMDAIFEQPTEKVSILDQLRQTPLTTLAYLRKRPRDMPLHNSIVHGRVPSLRRSRSSTRGDHCKRQRSQMLFNEADECGNNLALDEVQDESAMKNKLIRKSPDIDVIGPHAGALAPNGSCKDIGTEAAETTPSNNGSTLESRSKDEESMTDFLGKCVNVNGMFDVQTKTIILKKKRKPNKKRFVPGITAHANLDEETDLKPELKKNPSVPPESFKKINERFCKTDGDEHLPLVKRARARMGKLSVEKQLDEMVGLGEKSEKVPLMSQSDQINTSPSSGDNCIGDRTLVGAINAFDNSSNDHHPVKENDPVFWKIKKFPLRANTLDVEAALPPSKRLHRALEAMSANADEAKNDCTEGLRTMDVLSNRFSDFSKADNHQISVDSYIRSPRESHSMPYFDGNEVHNSASDSGLSLNLPSQNPEAHTETSAEEKPGDMCLGNSRSLQHGDSREIFMVIKDHGDSFNSKTVETELHGRSPEACSSDDIEKKVNISSSQSTLDQSHLQVTEGSTKDISQVDKEFSVDVIRVEGANLQRGKLDAENETAKPDIWNLDCDFKGKEGGNILSQNATGSIPSIRDGDSTILVSGTTKSLNSQSDENSGSKDIQEITVEVKHKSTPKELGFSPDSTPMKVLIAAAQAKRLLSRSTSLSDNAINDKYLTPDGVSCPSPSEQASPQKPMVDHTHTMEGKTNCVDTSSRSPDVISRSKNSMHLMDMNEVRSGSVSSHKQNNLSKLVGHAEATIARKSFETMLCTLSRAKESIGRATRLAIDCAKYGLSGEVVQILLQYLERESSLHRKVDLFFLVDSITQCSRGQKGVAGDVYPSLFQSVLPRLLSAAAPPGNAAWENRRQCLKVLRLWLERRTLPESIVRHHIRELDYFNEASFSSGSSRRPSRNERALNDPVREMEGMLVDEYGSNTSFHLPGLLGSCVLEDEEEESANDEKSFEAVTPEMEAEIHDEAGTTLNSATEKHRHILEDVDGELEMEDVAPTCEVEMSSTYCTAAADSAHASHYQYQHISPPFAPPLPEENPPSPPPLPSSPPPMVPPCPFSSHALPPPSTAATHSLADDANSHLYRGPHNIQGPFSGPMCSTPNLNSMSSDTVSYYAPGYRDFGKQMSLTVSSDSSGNIPGSHPSMHTGNDILPLGSGPLPSNGYHLQPPPQTVSNQFSYVQADQQKQMQCWVECSSPFNKTLQFAHDARGGNFHCDRVVRGPVQPEIAERCRYSAASHSGSVLSEKVEASPNSVAYNGPPSETSHPSHGWSIPPRASNYQYSIPVSRPPMENQISRVAGGALHTPGYWRPR